jgi:ERCC4-type nuclease
MSYNLYIDPSELKSSSKFKRHTRGLKYVSLPGLEEMTGADIMISPVGLPKPITKPLMKLHLDNGALLVQLKFGHDLVASIIDNRLKESLAKMLAAGAAHNQAILFFIGLVFEPEKEASELMINGSYVSNVVPGSKNFKFKHYLEHRQKWALRGGIFEQITLETSLKQWIESAAKTMNEAKEKPVKRAFEISQSITLVKDWRNLLVNLPDIGEIKAIEIYNWLEDKSFYGFLAALEDGSLANVPGIGAGTIKKIKDYFKGV